MMPHPDRSSESLLGSVDGYKIFASIVEALEDKKDVSPATSELALS
jgi:hypothetical protein